MSYANTGARDLTYLRASDRLNLGVNDMFDNPLAPIASFFCSARNPSVSGTTQTLTDGGADQLYLTTPQQLTISSTSAQDTFTGGTTYGARVVKVEGLDANYAITQETVVMNGQTPVTTAKTYSRVFRLLVANSYVSAGGLPSVANQGVIYLGSGTVTAGVPANKFLIMPVGTGQSRAAVFTIPAGYIGFVERVLPSVGSGKEVKFGLRVRVYSAALGGYSGWIESAATQIYQNTINLQMGFPQMLGERFDVELFASMATGSADVSGQFEMIIIRKDIYAAMVAAQNALYA